MKEEVQNIVYKKDFSRWVINFVSSQKYRKDIHERCPLYNLKSRIDKEIKINDVIKSLTNESAIESMVING